MQLHLGWLFSQSFDRVYADSTIFLSLYDMAENKNFFLELS